MFRKSWDTSWVRTFELKFNSSIVSYDLWNCRKSAVVNLLLLTSTYFRDGNSSTLMCPVNSLPDMSKCSSSRRREIPAVNTGPGVT